MTVPRDRQDGDEQGRPLSTVILIIREAERGWGLWPVICEEIVWWKLREASEPFPPLKLPLQESPDFTVSFG